MNNEEKSKQENNFLKEMIRTYYVPEINRLNNIINKAIEYIDKKLEYLEMNKQAIMSVLTPENGYLKADVEFAIREKQELLEILESNGESND